MSTIKVDTIQTRTGSGNITASNNIAGNLVGDVTGNVTGNLTGNSTVGGTLGVTGLVTASGGVAIGGTGSANTLDDYEEGTFTPVPIGSSTAGTWTPDGSNYGKYTKIGDRVFITVNCSGHLSSPAGAYVFITGLPYTCGGSPYAYSGGACAPYSLTNAMSAGDNVIWWSEAGTDRITIGYANNQNTGGLNAANHFSSAGRYIRLQGMYHVN